MANAKGLSGSVSAKQRGLKCKYQGHGAQPGSSVFGLERDVLEAAVER